MREIGFRAWNKVKCAMVTDAVNNCKDSFEMVLKHPQIYEVMQHTGMSDKNRTAIYDKDYVKDEENGKVFEVFWNNIGTGCWWFATRDKDGSQCHARRIDLDDLVVIGNVYESPLLEVK